MHVRSFFLSISLTTVLVLLDSWDTRPPYWNIHHDDINKVHPWLTCTVVSLSTVVCSGIPSLVMSITPVTSGLLWRHKTHVTNDQSPPAHLNSLEDLLHLIRHNVDWGWTPPLHFIISVCCFIVMIGSADTKLQFYKWSLISNIWHCLLPPGLQVDNSPAWCHPHFLSEADIR